MPLVHPLTFDGDHVSFDGVRLLTQVAASPLAVAG